ncbi:protein phosphatase 2C domain-containing protein [Jatrophihabitans telluris]|uniref:Protein phosphatase 2C domain-containing protein n=1 Tax=Jatrophihabitans telluris TaxID=2038343 RepID=A0ABY4R0P3_9ACTN|nr:protein phosphatase 2C domain-containing protein [Jatrophihabitans telluris]UQX88629.1 protein phosphatase 2C domain-containing protein [Jatrophihabitans telluris]
MPLRLSYAVRSDRGLVRNNNEDSVYAGPRLLAIADGMGGHAAGEVASNIVIGTLEALDEDRPIVDLIGTLRESVSDANAAIAESVDNDPELEGMGTTLTAIRFAGSRIALVHVGDSRAYLMRNGQLSQITHDDTYVQSLVDSGKLTPEEASHHPRKSVILRALTGSEVDPDISIREARVGDRYLLCSDGLSDVVSAATLGETLTEGTPQGCADRLIELALRGGGPDNVTCIVADVVDDGVGDDRPVVGGAVMDPRDPVVPQEDSPASRAARIGREEPEVVVSYHRPRRWRRPVIVGCALALVVAAGIAGWTWTQSQYFVGRDGTEVALFRGVNAEFGPLSLYSVVENSDIKVNDLTPSVRTQVNNGITASGRGDGEQILARLTDSLLPLCSSLNTTASTPASPSVTPKSTPPTPKTSARPSGASRTTPAKSSKSTARSTAARSSATRSSVAASGSATPSGVPSTALDTALASPDPSSSDSCRNGQ